MSFLLDTNIITALIHRQPQVISRFAEVRLNQQSVAMSSISYYEIKRGLLAVPSPRKMAIFTTFFNQMDILPITHPEIVEIASEIYADLRRRGCLIQDADILIAATAIARKFILVSNDSDLARVAGQTHTRDGRIKR